MLTEVTVELTGAEETTGAAVSVDVATTGVDSVDFDGAGVAVAVVDGTACAVGDSSGVAAETKSVVAADVGVDTGSAFETTVTTELGGARRVLAEALPRNTTTRKIAPTIPRAARIAQRSTVVIRTASDLPSVLLQ